MSNIELVIKIPEEEYKKAKSINWANVRLEQIDDLEYVIANGIPLPKGHGVLKDTDAMINKLCTQEASEFFGSTTCAEIMDFIDDEKPIVEADKEGSEE